MDDNDDARWVMSTVLTHAGAHVLVAASGEEALHAFRRAQPHVVVTDIAMPRWSGYRLLRAIRSLRAGHGGRTPVVAVTAFRELHHEARARRAGFDAWLTKPIDLQRLVALVQGLIRPTRAS